MIVFNVVAPHRSLIMAQCISQTIKTLVSVCPSANWYLHKFFMILELKYRWCVHQFCHALHESLYFVPIPAYRNRTCHFCPRIKVRMSVSSIETYAGTHFGRKKSLARDCNYHGIVRSGLEPETLSASVRSRYATAHNLVFISDKSIHYLFRFALHKSRRFALYSIHKNRIYTCNKSIVQIAMLQKFVSENFAGLFHGIW